MEHQPGYRGIFVFNKPEENKEISVTFWQTLAEMEAFDLNLLPIQDQFMPLLEAAPEIEIFQVVVPEDVPPIDDVALSEASLGIRIEDPFSTALR
ncbi:MAG: hypothetical protein KC449_06380 [Anaerolineales bacterium]|nr:hypothetical protein [Anaerolineales bacterium]